jgi:hypothetical protein
MALSLLGGDVKELRSTHRLSMKNSRTNAHLKLHLYKAKIRTNSTRSKYNQDFGLRIVGLDNLYKQFLSFFQFPFIILIVSSPKTRRTATS